MRGDKKKSPIVGVVERKGRVVAKAATDVGSATLLVESAVSITL